MFKLQTIDEKATKKEIKKAENNKELIIITYDIYDKSTHIYKTKMSVNAMQFYLDKTRTKPEYIYECKDFREKEIIMETETVDIFKEEQNNTIKNLKQEWEEYKKTLMEKYPAEEGQEWEFTCEHHQKIDELLKNL